MKKKIRIFALLLVVAMLLSAFAYAHEETDSAKIHLTGETLSEADDVQAIGNRAIFISTQNKIASVDDSQQEYVAEYVPEYQIEFAIPYQNKGVMIGSEKPTMVACPNALCKDEYELSWEGTYEYFDLTTGAVRAIRDPNTFYIAATSVGLTDQSNYTTTINGKSIPNAQYPAGGTYRRFMTTTGIASAAIALMNVGRHKCRHWKLTVRTMNAGLHCFEKTRHFRFPLTKAPFQIVMHGLIHWRICGCYRQSKR